MPGRTFSREFKLSIVRQLANGEKRLAQVCREHRLADSVLARWRREFTERGEAAFTPKAGTSAASPLETCIVVAVPFTPPVCGDDRLRPRLPDLSQSVGRLRGNGP